MVNLDTHILLFALLGDALNSRERDLLSSHEWGIASIVLWEVSKLQQLGRIAIDLNSTDVRQCLDRLHVWPLSLSVAQRSTHLDFKGDPADELIAATSIVNAVPLLTRDSTIRNSRIVPLAIE
jgi:PIN domain nuclease of toxin-antitoxin system